MVVVVSSSRRDEVSSQCSELSDADSSVSRRESGWFGSLDPPDVSIDNLDQSIEILSEVREEEGSILDGLVRERVDEGGRSSSESGSPGFEGILEEMDEVEDFFVLSCDVLESGEVPKYE